MGVKVRSSTNNSCSSLRTAKHYNQLNVANHTVNMMSESRVPMTIRDFFFDDPFFKASWDNFDQVREKMFEESRDMWKKFDQDFRSMACMSNNVMVNSNMKQQQSTNKSVATETENAKHLQRQNSLAEWENGWMFPRRWMLPSLKSEFRDMDLFMEKDSEVIRVKNDDKKMEVSLDTSQYRPDELNVSIADGAMTIQGKHEEKAEDGTKMVSRQFVRKYTLPAGAKPEDVVSNLSSDGVLVVTANKSNPAIEVKINQK